MESYHPAPVKTEKSTPAPAPGPVFIQNSESGSCSGKNHKLRHSGSPAPWSPLCPLPGREASRRLEKVQRSWNCTM